LQKFRKASIKAEIYPDLSKVKKQLDFATKKGIHFVGICGDNEIKDNLISIKNLETGDQESLTIEAAISKLSQPAV
jgi:histidyl-tRNA synthetase